MATWNQPGYDSYSGCDIVVTARLATLNNSTKKYIRNYFAIKSRVIDDVEKSGLDINNIDKRFGRFLPLYGLFLRRH